MKFFDADRFKEIADTLTRNRGRSLLTGFGVFWGIFMLLFLMGGGQGLKQLLEKNFAGFASNSAILFAGQTTKAYKGFSKGRYWRMSYNDIDRLKSLVPELDVISPTSMPWTNPSVSYGDRSSDCNLNGIKAEQAEIQAPTLRYGRYINDMDVAQRRKVCVITRKIYTELFPGGGDPCGKRVKIDSVYYNIVGVNYSGDSGMWIGGDPSVTVAIPITVVQQAYNRGDDVDWISVTAKKGVRMSDIIPKMRKAIATNHYIDPTDEPAIEVMNMEIMFTMISALFKGVNFLIWLIGIGTLLAGVIGVSNIMMITVKERTTEIGIRRAIGATPKMILSQIIWESVILTFIAGFTGILLAVVILSGLDLANTVDGILKAEFQVNFWMAIFAVFLLTLLGVAAGMAPAARAMSIKPVDAMRDE